MTITTQTTQLRDGTSLSQAGAVELGAGATVLPAVRSPDDFLTNDQLADEMHVSPRTPEGWRANGTGPKFSRAGGRRILYRWGDVVEWLQNRAATSTTEEQAL